MHSGAALGIEGDFSELANICSKWRCAGSSYTRVKLRNRQIQKHSEQANQLLRPLIGTRSFNVPAITEADYIELVDFTGRQWHAGKKGIIEASAPRALTKLGLDKKHWTYRIKGVGFDSAGFYWAKSACPLLFVSCAVNC